ncbi:MAG: ABC transporter permease [Hyphomicrobiales bacterium]
MATQHPAIVIETPEFVLHTKQRGLWSQAWQRLIRNRLAVVAGVLLLVVIAMATLTSVSDTFERYDPHVQQYEQIQSGPNSKHFLGTDNLGRDIWSRMWEGMRISLKIGIGTQVIVLIIGIAVGAGAALGGKWTDNILMRFTDLMFAFPDLLAIIIMRAVLSERDWPIIGTGDPQIPGFPGLLLQVIFAISLVAWVTTARLVRGQMLSLKESDYVMAARALGASTPRIVFTHMLPNTLGPVIVAVTFGIPLAIFAEAVLGFIGFGLPPPTASLGTLVNDGFLYYRVNEWMILVPSVAIAVLMLCFTFLGDGLRDALDPRTRR